MANNRNLVTRFFSLSSPPFVSFRCHGRKLQGRRLNVADESPPTPLSFFSFYILDEIPVSRESFFENNPRKNISKFIVLSLREITAYAKSAYQLPRRYADIR